MITVSSFWFACLPFISFIELSVSACQFCNKVFLWLIKSSAISADHFLGIRIDSRSADWILVSFLYFFIRKMLFMYPENHLFCQHFSSLSSQKIPIRHTELSSNIVELWTRTFNYSLQNWIFCCLLSSFLEFLTRLQWKAFLGIYMFIVHEVVHQLRPCISLYTNSSHIVADFSLDTKWWRHLIQIFWLAVNNGRPYTQSWNLSNPKAKPLFFDQSISAHRLCPLPEGIGYWLPTISICLE